MTDTNQERDVRMSAEEEPDQWWQLGCSECAK